ncbi:MAG: (2Fe-2S)-binding protein [Termitinemataceae bacterium]|nr:MAG: (2Fe-2S)-binding protein [Termitinemataceae bacterium]
MHVSFTLNGKEINLDTEPNKRLLNILRDDVRLTGSKCGCLSGICGLCSVIFSGDVTPSCLIPAFRLQDKEIITIEHFARSPAYKDIILGFSASGVKTCGICDTGKILTAEQILKNHFEKNSNLREAEPLSRKKIAASYETIRCRCTVLGNLIDGVLTAYDIRSRRLNND